MKKSVLRIGLALLMTAGIAGLAFGATSGPTSPAIGSPTYTSPLTSGDAYDNYMDNDNDTGLNVDNNTGAAVNDVIKSDNMKPNFNLNVGDPNASRTNQRTHGEYQNNTNSCASCHQVHTAASKQLLFKDGVYNSCTACHDGTLGFYNVFNNNTATDKTKASTAGTFGGSAMGNASVHLADGTQLIKAAPGGNKGETNLKSSWNSFFNCASCHAPHGSYSDRLLHYNPNNVSNNLPANGGIKLSNIDVVNTLPTTVFSTSPSIVLRTTAGAEGITGEAAAEPVLVLYKVAGTTTFSYVRDTNPWVYGYDRSGSAEYHWTQFKPAGVTTITGELINIEVEAGLAYAKGADVVNAVKADIAPAVVVKLSGSGTRDDGTTFNYPATKIADFGGVDILKIDSRIYDEKGFGVPIGQYCGACHTDYLAKSGTNTGVWSKAFRHTTNNDSYTCLKCHFAHGTDAYVMQDAQDNTIADLVAAGKTEVDAFDYMVDKNPDSALKRYTNMAVCWKCHTESKASQLKNNTYYWNQGANRVEGPNNW